MENTYKAWVLSSRQQLWWKLASGITFDPILVKQIMFPLTSALQGQHHSS